MTWDAHSHTRDRARAAGFTATHPVVLCPHLYSIELLLPTDLDSQNLVAELMIMSKARAAVGYAVRDVSSTSQVSYQLALAKRQLDW